MMGDIANFGGIENSSHGIKDSDTSETKHTSTMKLLNPMF